MADPQEHDLLQPRPLRLLPRRSAAAATRLRAAPFGGEEHVGVAVGKLPRARLGARDGGTLQGGATKADVYKDRAKPTHCALALT